jgi:hypothetical protein
MSLLPEIMIMLLIATAVGIWWSARPKYSFVVQIVAGKPVCRRGKVTEAFLRDVAEVCEWSGVLTGSIYGTVVHMAGGRGFNTVQRTRVKLSFSSAIPEGCRQQLRNLSLVQQ